MNGSNARFHIGARGTGYRKMRFGRARVGRLIGIALIAVGLLWLYDTLRQALGVGDGLFFGALDLVRHAGSDTDAADVVSVLGAACGMLAAYMIGRLR